MTVPMENTLQRHEPSFVAASARAVAPDAATGAIGNGSFSTSDVTRKSTYPMLIQLRRPSTSLMTRITIGISHAAPKKVRFTSAAEPAGGTTQFGISFATSPA